MPIESATAVPWSTRVVALLEVATELGARAAGTRKSRRRSSLLALRCLAAFANKQCELFGTGFADGVLEVDRQFPPAYVLESTARQVAFDIDVLLRTIGQRDEASSTSSMRATLKLGDRLATQALAPAVRHHLIEETGVLTYFQKTPTIRLLPYVPLALIGIDLTAIQDTARLLAIAHESGHHVYRQMTVNYMADLDEQVVARAGAAAPTSATQMRAPSWLLAWEEEIFADVYGVLVAGPVAGLSVQAMLMAEAPAVLLQDDADHPLPALRPEIATIVLRKLAAGANKQAQGRLLHTADLLRQQWRHYLAEQQVEDAFTPAGERTAISLDEGCHHLQFYVEGLLDGPLATLAGERKAERWSKGLANGKDELPELYSQFSATCSGLAEDSIPELRTAGNKTVTVTPQVAGVRGGQRIVGQIGEPYLDRLRDDALAGRRHLASGAWQAVFLAGDWVTEEGGSGIIPVRR